jgi:hypothetical protein
MISAFFPIGLFDENSTLEKEDEKDNSFRLPIEYVPKEEVYPLSCSVATDLELVCLDPSANTMYHYLLNPKTPFEENMIPLWSRSYTTNAEFLKDSQKVCMAVGTKIEMGDTPDYEEMKTIWRDIKEDPEFLERYSYMDLEMFRWVNKMPSFLQSISLVNMASPILSFLIPFVLFLMPFFIVRMQGHPITLSMYFSVLKDISKNHFIGKMLSSAENFNVQNLLYILILIGLYFYQIYQNYMTCVRFYSNISRINRQLCVLQKYVEYTVEKMGAFEEIAQPLGQAYYSFGTDIARHRENLVDLGRRISCVRPFVPSLGKVTEIGELLGCYYELFSNVEYGQSLNYSFSFHGYLQNIRGLYENSLAGHIGFAEFVSTKDKKEEPENEEEDLPRIVIKDQYYPALINQSFVTNSVDLSQNMTVTGPNAAGKTTFLKSTILNVIFTQQFGCGFYSSCSMLPYTHIHSYLNIPDTSGRDSLFQAESRRCKEIIDCVRDSEDGARHFCIFDELYSGTNPVEASKSAYAFLSWLSQRKNVDFILTTHYTDICSRWGENDRISNWQITCNIDETGEIEYTYSIERGISKVQGAIKVLRDMNYPTEILGIIEKWDHAEADD